MNSCRILGAAILVLVIIVGCRDQRALPKGSERRAFNAAEWHNPKSSDPGPDGVSLREEMLGDLVKHLLPGKSRQEIESLLGPSLDTPYFRTIPNDFIYYLGPERGSTFGNIDSEWLLLSLDEHGRFRSYSIQNG